jgi:hypothetical protein
VSVRRLVRIMAPVREKVFPENFPVNLKFKDVANMMKEHIGRIVWSRPGGLDYRITGISKKPLSKLRFRKSGMTEYYKKWYNVDLKYLNYPVFNCTCSMKIPPELARVELYNDRFYRRLLPTRGRRYQ